MKVVIASLGSIGRRHLANLRALRPGAEIAVLRRSAGEETPVGADRVLDRLGDALDFQPDMALVCGPASQHVEVATAFARRGSHLFVEKPLSDRLDGVDDLIALCERANRVLMVGFVLRFSTAAEQMRTEVGNGRVGQIYSIRAEVGQSLPEWRPDVDYRQTVSAQSSLGGGAVLELSHELDLVRWLGGDVRSVMALEARIGGFDSDVEDLAEILLEFESGALGTVHVDMVRRPQTRRCEIVGEYGVLTLDGLRQELTFQSASGELLELSGADPSDRNLLYIRELEHFLKCVEGGAKPVVGGLEGREALALALAVKRSAALGELVTP